MIFNTHDAAVSDLTRQAEANLRNEERLYEWRRRYRAHFGKAPAHPYSDFALIMRAKLCPWLFPRPAKTPRRPAHGNANVVKFPRRHGQYIGADLPTGPESA